MPDRAQLLAIIDRTYEARVRGDKEGVAPVWAPGSTYRLCGEQGLMPSFPAGPGDAGATVESIIDLIRFDSYEQLEAIVEGNRVEIGRDTSELQSRLHLVCRLLLEKKKTI